MYNSESVCGINMNAIVSDFGFTDAAETRKKEQVAAGSKQAASSFPHWPHPCKGQGTVASMIPLMTCAGLKEFINVIHVYGYL